MALEKKPTVASKLRKPIPKKEETPTRKRTPVKKPAPKSKTRGGMKEALAKRLEESNKRKDDMGIGISYFEKDGVQTWRCDNGEHIIDVIPYIVGNQDPNVEEDQVGYVLDVWVHFGIGPAETAHICPARTYQEPCPICEYVTELKKKDDYDEDLVKTLYPKRRCLYNVIVHDSTDERRKGVQVWEVAYFFSEKHFNSLAKKPRDGGYIFFPDPEEGKSIFFERKGSRKSTEFIGFKFVDREESITDKILEQAHCLDSLLKVPTYEEISEAFYGSAKDKSTKPSDEGEEEPEPAEEEEENQDGEGEEASTGTRGGAASSRECPVGGTFGSDWDQYEECADCKEWEPCCEAHEE